MDKTIRNLDPVAYRTLKARAVAEGRTLGAVVNEAMAAYVGRPIAGPKSASLADVSPEDFGPGTEQLSNLVDAIVYGT